MGNSQLVSELDVLKDSKRLAEEGFMIYNDEKNRKKGKIIFSLDDFPLKQIVWSSLGNKFFRFNPHMLEINGLKTC